MSRPRVTEILIAVAFFGLLALVFVQFAPFRGATVGGVDITTHHTSPYMEDRPTFVRAENTLQTDQNDGIALAAAFWGDVRSGDLRLWESDLGTGAPLGGVIYTRVWSPFYWVGALVPGPILSSFAVWLTLWCAQLGGWALARYLGVGRMGSLLAGVAFGFSGPTTALLLRINEVAISPWVFLGVHLTVDRDRVKPPVAVACLALAVAAMWMGGFPAGSIFTLYGAGAIAIGAAVLHEGWHPQALARRLALPVAGVILGTALAAPLLLPSYDFLLHSESLDRSYPSTHAAGLELFGTSVSGRLLGTYQNGTWWWPDPGYSNPVEASATVGAVVLLVLAIGSLSRREASSAATTNVVGKLYLPLGAVILVGTFVGGPVLAILQFLPFVESNSFGRSRFILSLAVALAAGIALEAILRRNPGSRRRHRAFRVLSGAVVVLALTSASLVVLRALEEERLDRVLTALVVPALCVGLAALGYVMFRALRRDSRRYHRFVGVTLTLLLAVELQWGAWEFTPVLDPDEPFYPEHEMFELMRPDISDGPYRFAGTALNVIRPNVGAVLDMADLRISNPSYGRYRELMRAIDPGVFDRARLRTWFTDQLDPSSIGLDRSAVKYLVAPASAGILEAERSGTTRLRAGALTLTAGNPIRGIDLQLPGMDCELGFATVLHEGTVVGRIPLRTAKQGSLTVPVEDLQGPLTAEVVVDECGGVPAQEVTLLRAESDTQIEVLWADDGVLYRRDNARPRFELATNVIGIKDKGKRLQTLMDPDYSEVSVLDDATDRRRLEGGTVDLLADDGDRLRLRVHADGPGLLIVRDANAPGWKAEVNGEPTPIVHVDHAFRGVYVMTGTSIVEMVYTPSSRLIGTVSTMSGLLIFGAWVWRRRLTRPLPSEGTQPSGLVAEPPGRNVDG